MNRITSLPLVETGFLSNLIIDYFNQNKEVNHLYSHFPDFKGFENQLKNRENFSQESRELLVSVLKSQNKDTNLSNKSKNHIDKILEKDTFTVTTGHQLNLFTGPLYVIYKLLSTINLVEELQEKFPQNHFIPIFWMATEDHDFEEINHFWVENQKLEWNRESNGAVGDFDLEGLDEVFSQFERHLEHKQHRKYLLDLFGQTYNNHKNLADANRYLINELFGKYGLVIVDGNDKQLKSSFKEIMKDELLHQVCEKEVSKTNKYLSKKYKVQVNPRDINLFYLSENRRERIILKDNIYIVNNASISFSKEELLQEIDNFPERFSPNVLIRPVFQEAILPNLAYIGGAGELAYWLQLKSYFDSLKIEFPLLIHRNSALIITEKQQGKLDKLKITYNDLLLPINELISKKVKEHSEFSIDFTKERTLVETIFNDLEIVALRTDQSFKGAVKAQKQKQLNGLNKLEKRLLKAEKRKHQEYINQLTALHAELYPNGILQERIKNFTELYIQNETLIDDLKHQFSPLDFKFDIFKIS